MREIWWHARAIWITVRHCFSRCTGYPELTRHGVVGTDRFHYHYVIECLSCGTKWPDD